VSPHLVRSARRERSRGSTITGQRDSSDAKHDDSIEQSQSDDPIDPNSRTAVLTRRHG
jgi:hypothetical protein